MKAYILLGNTRENSNTAALAGIFRDELAAKGVDVKEVPLRTKNVQTCVGCDECHGNMASFGCVTGDDMKEIAEGMLASDLIVLASPIYSWMPTPILKAVMDRAYAFTKYPEDGESFNLMKKQKFAMIATSAEACEENCDLFDEAVSRMADFAGRPYLGCLTAQDLGDGNIARPDVVEDARSFAEMCMNEF